MKHKKPDPYLETVRRLDKRITALQAQVAHLIELFHGAEVVRSKYRGEAIRLWHSQNNYTYAVSHVSCPRCGAKPSELCYLSRSKYGRRVGRAAYCCGERVALAKEDYLENCESVLRHFDKRPLKKVATKQVGSVRK